MNSELKSSRGGLDVERLLHIQLKVVTYASVDRIPFGVTKNCDRGLWYNPT